MMSAYAPICSHMQPSYADIMKRMHPYAAMCSHMQPCVAICGHVCIYGSHPYVAMMKRMQPCSSYAPICSHMRIHDHKNTHPLINLWRLYEFLYVSMLVRVVLLHVGRYGNTPSYLCSKRGNCSTRVSTTPNKDELCLPSPSIPCLKSLNSVIMSKTAPLSSIVKSRRGALNNCIMIR